MKKWILVVESDENTRQKLIRKISSTKFSPSVWATETVDTALEICNVNGPPILVVCGLMLRGDKSGIVLANALNEGSAPPKIIFFTGANGEIAAEADGLVAHGKAIAIVKKGDKNSWRDLMTEIRAALEGNT